MIRDCHGDTRQRLLAHAVLTGKRVLEVGCASGRVLRMYADLTRLTVGIEPDFAAVRRGAQALEEGLFVCGTGMALPFGPACFDVVLFTLSLHHHPDCMTALEEARRVIDGNGLVLVIEPTPESEIQRLCKPFEDEDHRLTAVEAVLPRCGLETVSRETFTTWWQFADFEDVADYAFTYYGHPPDAEKREALRSFLGRKVLDAPLLMTDTLRLTCLRPPG